MEIAKMKKRSLLVFIITTLLIILPFVFTGCMPTKAKINGIIEEIYFDGSRFMPYIKKSVTEKLPTMYLDNKRGSTDLEHLGINYFDFPKSVSYISFLVSLFTEEEDIIFDICCRPASGRLQQAVNGRTTFRKSY